MWHQPSCLGDYFKVISFFFASEWIEMEILKSLLVRLVRSTAERGRREPKSEVRNDWGLGAKGCV